MSSKKSVEPVEQAQMAPPIVVGVPTQVIYADRILNMGIGASVSKLTLALDVGDNTVAPFANLVLPTTSLLEALEFMSSAISSNEELKKSIVAGLDALRDKLTKTAA
jgi:hypothetical protein